MPSTKQAVSWTTIYEHQSSNLEEFVIPSIKAPSKKEVTTTSLKEKKANDDEIQRCRKIRINIYLRSKCSCVMAKTHLKNKVRWLVWSELQLREEATSKVLLILSTIIILMNL